MERLGIDVPSVTRDEAVELCVYHLQMAASYFEATPDDQCKQLSNEIDRKAKQDVLKESQPWVMAAKAWSSVIHDKFESMREDD